MRQSFGRLRSGSFRSKTSFYLAYLYIESWSCPVFPSGFFYPLLRSYAATPAPANRVIPWGVAIRDSAHHSGMFVFFFFFFRRSKNTGKKAAWGGGEWLSGGAMGFMQVDYLLPRYFQIQTSRGCDEKKKTRSTITSPFLILCM